MNKVILLGRVGSEPELKYTANSNAVCNFSVATSEKWKDKSGNMQENTEWSRIVVWGRQAESCNKYLSKGQQVLVEGKLDTRSYDDKEGNKRYVTEIKAVNVQFLSSAKHKQDIEEGTSLDKAMQIAKETLAEQKNENLFDAAKIKQEQLFDTSDIPF